jgi:hypothetical protein
MADENVKSPKPESLDEIVSHSAATLAEQIRNAAAWAKSELDLQIEVTAALKDFARPAKVESLQGHHNVTIAKGRPDSVYEGGVIVEYKTPGTLSPNKDAAGNRKLIEQIREHFNPKAEVFFSQWKILFGEVCGYDVENLSDKLKKQAEFYVVKGKPQAAPLLFAVHTYYAIFIKMLAADVVSFFYSKFMPRQAERLINATTSAKLKRELEELERGGIFYHLWCENAWSARTARNTCSTCTQLRCARTERWIPTSLRWLRAHTPLRVIYLLPLLAR